ncbi:MAG: UvrD-helicase domain-containing protein [Clostridia bacterium]|nr:UvrD-helicase domain-containing protein [Clostridia bacterium]
MNYDLSTLNEQQLAPLKVTEGAVLVTAGAGSGKTRLLTHRIAYLIKEKGVSPYNILAITFTNKAAGEMKERVAQMVDGADQVWISTFHSMCAKILRMDIASMPPFTRDFSIYSESDSDKVLKEVCAARGGDDKLKKQVGFHLSNWKNGCMSLADYLLLNKNAEEIERIGACINDYQERLKKNNALDFDDLLCKTYQLFRTCPQVLSYYANRFKYILVDEFQDTNAIQYDLVKLLASVHGNVFAVGDEDQCIYSWRGANFKNIFNFKNDFSSAQVFKLEQNYRSSPEIITVANNVIKNNRTRLDKVMFTSKQHGKAPQIYNAYDERDEALYVAQNISRVIAQGYKYDDIAVLMRMNALSRSIEEAFLSYNIPHRIFGGFKFYERVEIRNLIAYLRLFVNPKDDVSFTRIINFPKRGIGDGTIAKLQAIEPEYSLLENCLSRELEYESALYKKFEGFKNAFLEVASAPQKPLSSFVEKMINKFNIRSAYNPKDEEDLNRLMNIEQFISSVKEYEALNPEASLGDFLENITLSSENDEIGAGGAVTIATVHAVKGLEFKVVFIIGLEEGCFPISRALNSNSELEEERRLMYVAITRAEELLYMTQCSKRYLYGGSQYQMPSRFMRELGLLSVQEKKPQQRTFASSAFEKHISESDYSAGNFVHTDAKPKLFNHAQFMVSEKKPEKQEKDVSIYHTGQKVAHPKYGEGEIVDITPDGLVGDIVFEDFGKKSLMLNLAPLEIIED